MDWKLIAGLIVAVILLLINFWWFAIGQKKARLVARLRTAGPLRD
jgi:hypothetical protein